jgi:A/G-specific adenine glycosylase
MPWKGEKDPYKIWISEIILQQTRVQQGLAYYERFIKAFPDVRSLATAPEEKVYKLWEGLGYYSRCKNLIASAKYIHENLEGKFPEEFENILSLKGIGNYTASAIASFAFNKPFAVLDGNVFRVLSRFFGVEIPINTSMGKRKYTELAQQLLDKKMPGGYNQAIMDFGAVICKPLSPLCLQCPLKNKCVAYQTDRVSVLPVNEKIIRQKKRFFNYLVVTSGYKYYVQKRMDKDIWQNLYEFILIETDSFTDDKSLLKNEQFCAIFKANNFRINFISKKYSQKLTHQLITGRFFHIQLKKPLPLSEKCQLVSAKHLATLPFPKFIASYLRDKNVSLNLIQ